MPLGKTIHNIEITLGKSGQLARAAGAVVKLIAKEGKSATLKLSSGEVEPDISVGSVSALVRGVVMNPVDHPHGGGEGRAAISRKKATTPWGYPALGKRTRKRNKYNDNLILRRHNFRFTSTDGESIESYYHRFSKLMNDFKRSKHFPEKISSNLKFLNNLQPEWKRHVEVNELRAERLARTRDPSALMENSNNPYNYLNVGNQNGYNATQNVGNQVVPNAIHNPSVQNVGHHNRIVVAPGIANQNANQNGNGNVVVARADDNGNWNNRNQIRCYNCKGMGHLARNCTVRPRRRDATYLQTQLLIAQKEEAGIQLQDEEFDLMAAAGDLDEIEKVNANCI
ncbi:gag-pol polyprotein [Tanacetum coccineum]|uniref:Gag-pol polyprotein n=1 Tax=Tanacetum coccineum TaxID=301880 RepID=A0ABQ5AT64_9ASTR